MDWRFLDSDLVCLAFPCGIVILWVVFINVIGFLRPDIFEVSNYNSSDSTGIDYTSPPDIEDRGDRKWTVQYERKRYPDHVIRERHEYAWGKTDTDQAFEDADERGFISWLFN